MAAPLLAAGGLLGAVGSIQKGNAANQSSQFNAGVMENNANFASQQGAENQRRIRRSNAQFQGTQTASIGASGLQLSGSALNVLSDSAIEGELMALDAKVSSENKAKGLKAQASLERQRGKSARRAGFITAGSQILSAGAKLA